MNNGHGARQRANGLTLGAAAAHSGYIAVIMSVVMQCTAPAQRIADPQLHEAIKHGIELAGQQRYSEARLRFDEAVRRAPEHPAGYLNRAILFEVMSLDFETPVPQPDFDKALETAERCAEKLLARNERSAEGLYYMGMINSYVAYYKFRDGENWLSGLQHGFTAADYLEDCLEVNPNAYDAMTALGTYKYWKSRKMSFLTWTPFVDDERHAGINLLRIAEASAAYSGAQASNSLIWIYIEEERYADAIRVAQHVLKKYPANRLFLWGLASAAEKKGDWRMALDAYRRIVASLDQEVVERRYIEIQARAKIARMAYNLGDDETAARECSWVLANKPARVADFTADGATRIRNRIADMEKLREERKK